MIEIKVGKKKTLIDYSTGVKQGDNQNFWKKMETTQYVYA